MVGALFGRARNWGVGITAQQYESGRKRIVLWRPGPRPGRDSFGSSRDQQRGLEFPRGSPGSHNSSKKGPVKTKRAPLPATS